MTDISATSAVRRFFRFLLTVERRFRDDDALLMAAALSYTSLLSLVPLLAIGLAFLAAFPAFESIRGQLQTALLRLLVPEVGQQVRQIIASLIGNAGNLTAAGILGLVVTAVLLLVSIEDVLNRIFRIDKPRTPMSRLLVYWTVVTLGPILLAASLSIGDWLFPAALTDDPIGPSSAIAWAAAFTRVLMQMALFTLLFSAVPNRPVRLRHALTGGVAAALAVAALRMGFHLYVDDFRAYQSVYGALAALPILLFWMYLVWVVVLVGAEITAALAEKETQ